MTGLKSFLEYVYSCNDGFSKCLLAADPFTTHFSVNRENNSRISYHLSQNATGATLLKVFTQIVMFSSSTDIEGQCYSVLFSNGHEIRIEFSSDVEKPATDFIKCSGDYKDYNDIKLPKFSEFFNHFLIKPLNPPDNISPGDHWSLSILLAFEVARRVPNSDRYHHIPVAVGIRLALRFPHKYEMDEILKLFIGDYENRDNAFRTILERFFTQMALEGQGNSTEITLRSLMNLYLTIPSQNPPCNWTQNAIMPAYAQPQPNGYFGCPVPANNFQLAMPQQQMMLLPPHPVDMARQWDVTQRFSGLGIQQTPGMTPPLNMPYSTGVPGMALANPGPSQQPMPPQAPSQALPLCWYP